MELKCSKCGHTYSGRVTKDGNGLFYACPKCRTVNGADGLVVMAFAEDGDPKKDQERFVSDIEKSEVRTWYAYDTVEAFMDHWHKMVKSPDGMWYWVIYKGECICSGACDPYDEDIFKKEFGLSAVTGEELRRSECVFDITLVAAHLMRENRIEVEDSRELFSFCMELAQKFEAENPEIGDDYMDAIEELAFEKLTERFGRTMEAGE